MPCTTGSSWFRRSWMVNALGNLKEPKGHGSQLIYGGCWNFVGNLNRVTDQVSTLRFGVCKMLHNHRSVDGDAETDIDGRSGVTVNDSSVSFVYSVSSKACLLYLCGI